MQSPWELINLYSPSRSIKRPSSSPSISQPLHRVARRPLASLGRVPNLLTCMLTHELWASVYPPSQRKNTMRSSQIQLLQGMQMFSQRYFVTSQFTLLSGMVKAYIIYVSNGHDITGTILQHEQFALLRVSFCIQPILDCCNTLHVTYPNIFRAIYNIQSIWLLLYITTLLKSYNGFSCGKHIENKQ